MIFFQKRICLQLAEDNEYRSITNAPRGITPAKIFGRGIVAIGETGYEFQTAAFASEKDFTTSLRELKTILNDAYTSRAPHIPTIPQNIVVDSFYNLVNGSILPVGYNIDTKTITYYDFKKSKIIPILATNIDEVKISFVHAIIRMLSMQKENVVTVIDFANAFSKEMENVRAYRKKEEYANAFVSMNNEIINSNESEKEKYYFVIGTSTIKDNIGEELYDGITKLFTRLQDYPKVHIIFVDVSNSFKQISFEEWYNDAFDGRSGIWIGENFALQTLISISDLDNQEKRYEYPKMALLINKGKHEFIKFVTDLEDNDEE